ncbi:uncharacterized protein PFL1_03366 [Pseudozyma flocculosa PF-1]|uniref:Uncharacterized protein n=2 Tax=Pseudozyma flocculosa TaxID=84751 RepID=A0A061H889_9BASI|nr:uncharacterized protein PFL1_03366 [Pseudozyma flocculosa PF-1]EPQ29077.1 hypothetical protein PFL1_03366 [Pseudozyma flocculosa PF-1]
MNLSLPEVVHKAGRGRRTFEVALTLLISLYRPGRTHSRPPATVHSHRHPITIMASSGDSASAKRAAGQLQQDLGSIQGSSGLKEQGDKDAQVGTGMQKANEQPDAAGMTDAAGAKDQVRQQADQS